MLQLGAASRELRRALRPVEWVVLEDVALDARRDGAGRLVAPTSARQVAEHLGLTPGAVARALGRLRREGLLTYARAVGAAGQFGLSTYVLGTIPGFDVVEPADARPCPPPPRPARPHMDEPRAVDAHMVAVAAPRSVGADPPRRSVHDEVAAIDDLGAQERARFAANPPVPKRGRRAVTKPVVAQLSILDTADDSELAKDHEPSR